MNRAIFFDRDGVINDEIFRRKLNKWTAPHKVNEIKIKKNTLNILKKLKKKNFLFFVISNQPDYALGLTNLRNLHSVHTKVNGILKLNSIRITKYFYSYKHPNSIKKRYGPPCFDRKPNPFFLIKAKKEYNLNLFKSWLVGDRQTDIDCGLKVGVNTVGLINKRYVFNKNKKKPKFLIKNITQLNNLIK